MTKEEAIKIIENIKEIPHIDNMVNRNTDEALSVAINALKSEPKHGQWLSIKVMDDEADFGEIDGAECSVCGYATNSEYWAKTYYHYCPNCGARMNEVKE